MIDMRFAAQALASQVMQKPGRTDGGQYWDRTSDPYDVNVVLYR